MGRVQSARWDGLIRRLFSIKGGGSLLAETLADVFPVLQLEGGPIELLKLSGWILGMGGITRTSGVGETAGAQLFNPPDSGKLIVPTTVWWAQGSAGLTLIGVTDVALGTAVVGRQRDTREGVLARTEGILRSGNAPASPVAPGLIRLVANQSFKFADQEGLAVLAPGTGLTIMTTATNLRIDTFWLWRERVAEPSELSF